MKKGRVSLKIVFAIVVILFSVNFILAQEIPTGTADSQVSSVDISTGPGAGELECNAEGIWEVNGVPQEFKCNPSISTDTCCPDGLECNPNSGECIEDIDFSTFTACSELEELVCSRYAPDNIDNSEGDNVDDNYIFQEEVELSIYSKVATNLGISVADLNDFCDYPNDPSADVYGVVVGDKTYYYAGPCKCEWDPTAGESGAGACIDTHPITEGTARPGGGFDPTDDGEAYTCNTVTNALVNNCESAGIYELSWTSQLLDLAGTVVTLERDWCTDGLRPFSCPVGEGSVALSFFTLINLIISILVISGIYYVIRKDLDN